MLMRFCYFALNKLRLKCKNFLKFYRFMFLFGNIHINPGPSQYLPDNDNRFEPIHKQGLNFLHINVNDL